MSLWKAHVAPWMECSPFMWRLGTATLATSKICGRRRGLSQWELAKLGSDAAARILTVLHSHLPRCRWHHGQAPPQCSLSLTHPPVHAVLPFPSLWKQLVQEHRHCTLCPWCLPGAQLVPISLLFCPASQGRGGGYEQAAANAPECCLSWEQSLWGAHPGSHSERLCTPCSEPCPTPWPQVQCGEAFQVCPCPCLGLW